jgi:hypothetical protein
MQEIARKAGLSVGGVYWYFKSKDEIVHANYGSVLRRKPLGSDLRNAL